MKKPFRYFRYGESNCSPMNGNECEFNHGIITFSEGQECFHKESCKCKPYCIFYHPEGQKLENWQKNKKKVAKMCHYSQKGMVCFRSKCNFYHQSIMKSQVFQWEQLKRSPKITSPLTMTRVPVMVKNMKQQNNLSL